MPERKPHGFAYKNDVRNEISFPVGGIGAGSIGLSASGRFTDWEIFNIPGKNLTNGMSHFAIKAEKNGQVIDARVLNGPYNDGSSVGSFKRKMFQGFGHGTPFATLVGLPHFRKNTFEALFPKATYGFEDAAFPGEVQLEAFSSFIPHNSQDSSLPAALFAVTVKNDTDETLDYYVTSALGNPGEFNGEHTFEKFDDYAALTLKQRTAENPFGEGEVSLGCDADDISCQRYWYRGSWFDPLTVYWDDFNKSGHPQDRYYDGAPKTLPTGHTPPDHGVLSARVTLKPGEKKTIRFVISWRYPQQEVYWRKVPEGYSKKLNNFYGTQWQESKAVQNFVFDNWDRLESGVEEFRNSLYNSSLPDSMIDAVSANLALLVTPVIIRLEDGTLWGWEGLHDDFGSCEGSCTHVWNYQQALPHLFPDLERSLRTADFEYNQKPDGGLSFRQILPLGSGFFEITPCADGQFGSIVKAYREWKLCGDNQWLLGIWPKVKKALEYAWSEENKDLWDPDKTGVLWGRQHHTLDMELYSPNSWLSSIYLAALKATSEMAKAMDDISFSEECAAIYSKGRDWFESNLFTGEYFNQKIEINNLEYLQKFMHLSNDVMDGEGYMISNNIMDTYWSPEHEELTYQLGNGCSIDQLLGQWFGYVAGLGDIIDQKLVDKALVSIFKNNFREDLWDHVNPCRTYGQEDEGGVILITWPEGDKPAIPAPYAEEVWTGTEYSLASQLLYRGFKDEALKIIETARARYDGRRRNPWSEIECGSNYVRSLASFALLTGWIGQNIDAPKGIMAFNPVTESVESPWFSGCAWGSLKVAQGLVELSVNSGAFKLNELSLTEHLNEGDIITLNGKPLAGTITSGRLTLGTPVTLNRGDSLVIAAK